MRKTIISFAVLALCIAAPVTVQAQAAAKKTAVIYYSLSGNTEKVARAIAKAVNADLFKIETVQPYDNKDDAKLRELVRTEQNNKKWPAIKPFTGSLAGYQTFIVGSPVWFGTVSNPLMAFLGQTDFSAKRVILFGTNGGGEGSFFADFQKNVKNGTVEKGMLFSNVSTDKALDKKVADWAKKLKL